jgi:signal transduction histidine kinase
MLIPEENELDLTASKSKILLLCDPSNAFKQVLEQRWQVEVVDTIELQNLHHPDLIVIDLTVLDRLKLLQILRSNSFTQTIPILLLAEESAIASGLVAGADDYLIAPFSMHELVTRVKIQLQKSQLRQDQSIQCFKNEFIMMITHELQAPLATILAWARLLQGQSFNPARAAHALATIERNALVQAKLVKDLLDMSSILSGTLRLKLQFVELVPLVQNALATFQAAAVAKQILLIEPLTPISQATVLADGDRLRQIVSNLLDNAIKFTPSGGQVQLLLHQLGSEIQLTIRDTGIGIRPDFLPFVFDRFTQAEVPSRHSPGGLGIGLAIAQYLVKLHQGTIEVTSEGEGQGAKFTVRLPLLTELDNPKKQ